LDLSRKRVDACLISDQGELIDHFAAPADRDGLYGLTRRVAVYEVPVRGVVESMNGGYTGLCPRVKQSGAMDQRGPVSKHGPRYLRWGLMEAAIAASSHPLYKARYQATKRRLGRQRGAKVAQIDLARKLTEAIWYMLTRNQPFTPFTPAGAINRLTA
jgi:hypothetical protein